MSRDWKLYELENIQPSEKAVIEGKDYRITVLTSRLIRLEYQEDRRFTNQATQVVINRNFETPDFRIIENTDQLEIVTEHLHLYYNKKKFSQEGLSIQLKEGYAVYGSNWNYGDEIHDLLGTARTLDNADGAVQLENGLMSRDGFTVLDDSKSAVFTKDGWIEPRSDEPIDLYFWGYGHDYLGCLKDFYHLCGKTPMLPKFALGNWWSRFYPYTEESYLELMDRFKESEIPFSTAVIDMDWHLTDIPKKYGSGWTGYTWNSNYFPNPKRFMAKLHERGMHVTLNVHPADGVRAHEEAYIPMAKELGINYEKEDKIVFDASDKQFMEAYFKYLHHSNEEQGVDFWWLDWQQGSKSGIPGIDTLWLLNHFHFMDNGRDGKTPLTFSRYAGIGSHRYPIGFSGDTVTSWASLKFQPYFTANASNAGYTWWSHDIGGHQRGIKSDEMVARWVQLGVFSPIMRLHSTSNEFYGKEPWNYNAITEKILIRFLQLRHRMIPYLYTMNYLTHTQGLPLVQPMYYQNDCPEAYEVPNEYYFGSKMIVYPITQPADSETLLAEVDGWIPEGVFYDFFSHRVYHGNRRLKLYRDQHTIPVFVKSGSIVPLARNYTESHINNPQELDIYVYVGANGSFDMYEDDCSDKQGMQGGFTHFKFTNDEKMKVTLEVEERMRDIVPDNRTYYVHFVGVNRPTMTCVDGDTHCEGGIDYDSNKKELIIKLSGQQQFNHEILLATEQNAPVNVNKETAIYNILHQAQMEYNIKEQVYCLIQQEKDVSRLLSRLYELNLSESLYGAIIEILTSDN